MTENEMNTRRTTTFRKIAFALMLGLLGTLAWAGGSDDWRAPPSAANRPNPVAGNANATALGEKLFVANCVTCHGPAGHGDGPGAAALEKKPADLPKRVKETGEKDGELFWKISEGRTPMVSWKSLSETQRWELVNYIRTLGEK